uniref:Putative ovule protein n=1 Tax=Solanum chacoense TaxID=4108 RepID=A0A0V0HQF3_SOLCH
MTLQISDAINVFGILTEDYLHVVSVDNFLDSCIFCCKIDSRVKVTNFLMGFICIIYLVWI